MEQGTKIDTFDPARRFILGRTLSSRLELDFFNLYAWLLQYVANKKVLDLACGSGLGSFLLAHKADHVDGMDASEESIAFASNNYQRSNITFSVADVRTATLPKSRYEVIVFSMTLEQLEPQYHGDVLKKFWEATTPNGTMIVVTPNKKVTSPYSATGAHHWNMKEYSQRELDLLCRASGWQPIGWYGRRRVWAPLTWYPIRKAISAVQRILKINFGLYGKRENPAVLPVHTVWQPKDFVLILKKEER